MSGRRCHGMMLSRVDSIGHTWGPVKKRRRFQAKVGLAASGTTGSEDEAAGDLRPAPDQGLRPNLQELLPQPE